MAPINSICSPIKTVSITHVRLKPLPKYAAKHLLAQEAQRQKERFLAPHLANLNARQIDYLVR